MTSQATMEFIGVTTSQSSILRLFPRWAEELGLGNARLVGTDLPLHAEPEVYRETAERIAGDPDVRGALVTSHKVGLFTAAGDRFDEIDRYARLCGEISCISKRDGKLVGHAKDPITARRALGALLGDDHFTRTGGHVLCLGSGGAGLALATVMLEREDRPQRLVMTDADPRRLEAASVLHQRLDARDDPGALVRFDCAVPAEADRLLAAMPEGSLVVNATGMGKDIPGSPLGPEACFPKRAICWDLNYRGDLLFLQQAREQERRAGLRVENGWLYFLHGWSEHMAQVFGLEFTPKLFGQLRAIAEA